MTWASLSLGSAAELVHLGDGRESQLEGAVAMHNILQRERVAYLADEVGLGKTYVALTALALFRHFDPGFRVLVLAPKRNIQHKWAKDWRSFVKRNWLVTDLRVRAASGAPVHPVELPERLSDLVHDAVTDPRRDLMARTTSFSALGNGSRALIIERLKSVVPWVDVRGLPPDSDPDRLRSFLAQAYNAALPKYDLVIIDEAHNLRHGVSIVEGRPHWTTSQRNAALAQVLGHREIEPFPQFADTYRPLADRVLLMSATPVEDSLYAIWRQLHLVDKHEPPGHPDLAALKSGNPDTAKACASRILVRRVNAIQTLTGTLTKNQYRRTWNRGGVAAFDEQLPDGDDRSRLTVALVQKKVSDVVGTKFNNSFQMGMLASFESFQETASNRTQPQDAAAASDDDVPADQVFDDGLQTDDELERRGADTDVVNALARSHIDRFTTELSHPKMDALVSDLARSWERGTKSLVFVRRVKSVDELKRRLDLTYNSWLLTRLEAELPAEVWGRISAALTAYTAARVERGRDEVGRQGESGGDIGGADTFFAWFFRGAGPELGGMESGASVAGRTGVASGVASTFFAQNHLADLLRCPPEQVLERLAQRLATGREELTERLAMASRDYASATAGRREQYEAVQAAGLVELKRSGDPLASLLVEELGISAREVGRSQPWDVERIVATPTMFTSLHRYPELLDSLGLRPPEVWDKKTLVGHDLLCVLIATAARLGHSSIDLYSVVASIVGARPWTETDEVDRSVHAFVDLLEHQRQHPGPARAWHELSQIGTVYEEIRRINLPSTDAEDFTLNAAPKECADLLGQQQPTAGLARRVNATAVRQFRMPGYPYVMLCTDVLQEGEDLHTFCDRVIHYGVAWTASSMEQRIGRVDRIQSLTERRLRRIAVDGLTGDDRIQVQLPYLDGTVERLQARRVLERMHAFVELMHDGARTEEKRLDVATEILRGEWVPPEVTVALETAYPVRPSDVIGRARASVRQEDIASWFAALLASVEAIPDVAEVDADESAMVILGSRSLSGRVQPFAVRLDSHQTLPLGVVTTPVGRRVRMGDETLLRSELAGVVDRVVITEQPVHEAYDLTVAGDTLLLLSDADPERIATLVNRLTDTADDLERRLTDHDLSLAEVRAALKDA